MKKEKEIKKEVFLGYLKKVMIAVFMFQIIFAVCMILSYHADRRLLSEGEVNGFNHNWTVIREDGTTERMVSLPYAKRCTESEKIILENEIPGEYAGMTLSFTTEDTGILVLIDGKEIYSAGKNVISGKEEPQKREKGIFQKKNPFEQIFGSMENFVDLPKNMDGGKIQIVLSSPYKNTLVRVNKITISNRDIVILNFLFEKIPDFLCCLLLLLVSVIFFFFSFFRKISGSKMMGMPVFGLFCLDTFTFCFAETKILSVFYGNQLLYTNLVFLSLMLMPFLLILYHEKNLPDGHKDRKWSAVLMVLSGLNIIVQNVLQILGMVGFRKMVAVSKLLIFLTILMMVKKVSERIRREFEKSHIFLLIGYAMFFICGISEMILYFWGWTEKASIFSRIGLTVFCFMVLCYHIWKMLKSYLRSQEGNAKLLKKEVEYIEQQNKILREANEKAERAKEEAEAAKKEAMAANVAKGQFLARMSHEIRTPINTVLGMDEMILRESRDPEIIDYAKDIGSAGKTLLSLVDDILDFSKIESGKMEIIPVEYDLSSIIQDLMNMISLRAKNKGLELRVFVQQDLPFKLYGDDVRIRQILANMLTNAVKYTNDGFVEMKIEGQTDGEEVLLHFEVKDSGIGIKKEDIPKLFVEFERIEESRNRSIEGTGLGLNIVTQLLNSMGSRLEVSSEYGVGSVFSFDLRQKVIDPEEIGDYEKRILKSIEYKYQASFCAPDAKILVVDDNAINRKVVIGLLKETKVHITEASSGQECLDLVKKQWFDLIFLDHMMPKMDGVETLEEMKKMDNYPCKDTPVIVLTANAVTGAREYYKSVGFDGFLSKPIASAKLEKMLRTFLPQELLLDSIPENEPAVNKENGVEDLPVIDGIDWEYAWMHLSDRSVLEYTVKEFYDRILPEAEGLSELYQKFPDEEALNLYRIKVHAMKSSSAMIGALTISGLAKMLEFSARDGRLDVIDRLMPVFMEEWKSYHEKLIGIFGITKEEKKEEVDYTIVQALIEMLNQSMEEMDIDAADETMKRLLGYRYPEEIEVLMKSLGDAVANLDEDKAAEIIEEIKKRI